MYHSVLDVQTNNREDQDGLVSTPESVCDDGADERRDIYEESVELVGC